MSVYIPWMSMPKTCDDCQVSADCPNDEHIDGYNMQNRPRFCQLVPVPEHGQILRVLKTERECASRDCDRNCGKCELALEQSEILDVYDVMIAMFSPADKEVEG